MKSLFIILVFIFGGDLFVIQDGISNPNKISIISTEEVLKIANDKHRYIMENINDYTGILVKRELINGEDTGYQYIQFKYRENPRGVYLKFLKPQSLENREALYNGGEDLIVKRGGRRNSNMTLAITIDSPLATEGNRYTIKEMGLKILSEKLIEKLKSEVNIPGTEIKVYDEAKVDGRPVIHYKLIHNQPSKEASCTTAEISIDKELSIPIYYRAMNDRVILEEYLFRNIKLNPGLSDEDFSENNVEYGFQIRK